jgi:hypothetical protein
MLISRLKEEESKRRPSDEQDIHGVIQILI